ncbi:hypothetical protein AB0G54_23745 [Streptomyces yokosukanensis]|uniref:hypothetical protein n=1 Tax=Streptomyces yokosukanensis TaxID=67386 RepID=UPI00131AB870|nr:hypothetical protein [Streptomyces yokosukanensis]
MATSSNHHPSDKATYDITVTAPKDEDGDSYDVISNSTLIAEKDKGRTVSPQGLDGR